MAIVDDSALDDWINREDPPIIIRGTIRRWVGGLGQAPWQAPSTPFPELSHPPDYETRTAVVPESEGVEVFYQHDFATGDVSLIWVRNAF